mgnify:CR=1 FL=1
MKAVIAERLNGMGLRMEYGIHSNSNTQIPSRMADMFRWVVRLERTTHTQLGQRVDVMEIPYYTREQTRTPHMADVIHSLMSDRATILYADTFEEWAEGLGYNPDSREDERVFKQCKLHSRELERLFNNDELTDISEMLEDY